MVPKVAETARPVVWTRPRFSQGGEGHCKEISTCSISMLFFGGGGEPIRLIGEPNSLNGMPNS